MSGRSELGIRFVFGPAMLLLVGGVYWLDVTRVGGLLSACLLGVLALGAVHEFVAMTRKVEADVAAGLLYLATFALCTSAPFFGWHELDRELYPLVAASLLLLFPLALRSLTMKHVGKGLEAMGTTLLGFLWIAWPLYLAQGIALRHVDSLLFVVLVCKGGDIGAYLAGVALGRTKLIPHVSPGKTWEGSIGGLLASVGLSVGLSGWLLESEGGPAPGLTAAILLGIMLNVTTQSGDLVESLLKRRCGVKDSSTLLPAHGGILDLLDSLLFSFPAYFPVLVGLTGVVR